MLRRSPFLLTGLLLVSCTTPSVPVNPVAATLPATATPALNPLPPTAPPPPATVPMPQPATDPLIPAAAIPQSLTARIVYPAGTVVALRTGLRTQGLVTAEEMSAADLARLAIRVDDKSVLPAQVAFGRLEWDDRGQLLVTFTLTGLPAARVHKVHVASPDGNIALQAIIPAGSGAVAPIDVRSTAQSLLLASLAAPGNPSDVRDLPESAVTLIRDLLTNAILAGGRPNLLQTDSLIQAVTTVLAASANGTIGSLTAGNLPAILGSRPAATGGGGSGGGGTPTVEPVRAAVTGDVFDDLTNRLDGVTVTGQIIGAGLFLNGTNTLVTTTAGGTYTLSGAPVGATLLVTASKTGMTTRQQTLVPLSNPLNLTTLNTVSFGAGTDRVYSLSDKPEITSFTPTKDATGVAANAGFMLTFNESVNFADVESAFAVYVAGARTDIASGVDMTNPNTGAQGRYTLTNTQALLYTFDPAKDTGDATTGTPGKVRFAAAPIYDSASFTAAWSNNNQTVNFTFRPGAKLPTDKDPTKVPQYAVSFKDIPIRDLGGTGRTESWFRISPAQVGRTGYPFTVATDTVAPQVSAVIPINTDTIANNTTNDKIRVQFNETMALFPGNMSGASIPAGANVDRASNVDNYMYYVSPAGTTRYPSTAGTNEGVGTTTAPGTWQPAFGIFTDQGNANADAGGTPFTAIFYDGDATRATLQLKPRRGDEVAASTAGASQGFGATRTVWVHVKATVTDPAGNAVNSSGDANIRSGVAP